MSRRSWVTSSLVSRPEIFCCVFTGRTPRSEMLFVGQILVSWQNRVTSSWRPWQNSSRSRPGCWPVLFFGPGMRGTLDRPATTAWRDSCGGPGEDQPAQRPPRLHRPDGGGPALGRVLIVPDQVSQARLVSGDLLPRRVEVAGVPVRDHHAAEAGQD